MRLSIDRSAQIAECSHGVASAWLAPLEDAMRAFNIAQDLCIDLINDSDLLLLETHAADSAAWYWSVVDGNLLADEDSAAAFEQITIAIKRGLIGIRERTTIWTRARALLSAGE